MAFLSVFAVRRINHLETNNNASGDNKADWPVERVPIQEFFYGPEWSKTI